MEVFEKQRKFNVVFTAIFSFLISATFFGLLFVLIKHKDIVNILIIIFIPISIFITFFFLFTKKYRDRKRILNTPFPTNWRKILIENIPFYNDLCENDKEIFEKRIQIFLNEKNIYGVETEIDEKTKILIGASAIIPVFKIPWFTYDHLKEILIYPKNFDENYDFSNNSGNILGLVDSKSTMILSKQALYEGFNNLKDGKNVGFHEFTHKIDGEDGRIDGIPSYLINSPKLFEQWNEVYKSEKRKLEQGHSDINPYALTNSAEFFAVVTEYLFEDPQGMKRKHNELFKTLSAIFRQDFRSMLNDNIKAIFKNTGFGRRRKRNWK
ncbi:zinc-dependent peptidase [bacterium]|nr:zinc-dependent peptidase [bacterium]